MTKLLLLFTGLVLLTPVSLGQSSRGDTTPTRRVYYDVTVTGEFDFQGQHFVPADPNNMFNLHGRWIQVGTTKLSVARWKKVGFQIYSAFSPDKPSGASLINPALGTMQVSGSPELGNPPDRCTWDGATVTYNNVELDIGFALKPNQLENRIGFSVNRPQYSDAQKNSGCADWSGPRPWGSDWGWSGPNVTLPNKIKFAPSSPLSFWSAADAGTVPFPLDQILAGRSFVIETGTQSYANEKTGVRQQFSQRVEFTARKREKCAGPGPIADKDVVESEQVSIYAIHSQIEPDGSTDVKITVTCDGIPIKDAKVDLSIEPKNNSGHHMHPGRPGGSLDSHELADRTKKYTVTTDGKGSAIANFRPPGQFPSPSFPPANKVGLAGEYDVKAKVARFPESIASDTISVKFTNLKPLVVSPDTHYEVCARSSQGCQPPKPGKEPVMGESKGFGYRGTATHPEGEWGTEGTLRAFATLGSEFDAAQVQNNERLRRCGNPVPWPTRKLSLNDIALPEGGLFDADSTWAFPHQTHGRGQGGDVNHFYGDGVVTDCDGTKVKLDDFLLFGLLELGMDHGTRWDPELLGPAQRLHLHVED